MQLYSNLLAQTPLKTFEGDKEVMSPILKVLKHPHQVLNWYEFCQRLTESFWLYGNFYAKIKENEKGQIVGLQPFVNGTCYAYASGTQSKKVSGSSSDPILLDTAGSFYYQSQFGEGKSQVTQKFSADQIWHLKSCYQTTDLLNGLDLWSAYTETLTLAQDSLDTASKFSGSAMAGPLT